MYTATPQNGELVRQSFITAWVGAWVWLVVRAAYGPGDSGQNPHPERAALSSTGEDAGGGGARHRGGMAQRAPGAPGAFRSRPRRFSEESTAAGIYGTIVSAAVMAATHERTATAVAVTVLVTLVVYWAAERYSRIVAERIHDGRRPTWPRLRAQLASGWEIVTASTLPLVVLVAVTLVGAGLSVAVLAALGCSTLLLCVAGWEAGRGGRLTTRERVASAAVAGLFGLSMVALKALLH